MNLEEAKKIADGQLEKLVLALESGQSEGLKGYMKAMSKLFRYSFRNALLIWSQRPEATNVAGFQTWKKQGRSVKKGEKGIVIFAPIAFSKAERDVTGADNNSESSVRGFRARYVFDVSQTEGEPIPEIATTSGEPGEYLSRLKETVEGKGIALSYKDDLDGALGFSCGGSITIKSGLSEAEEFSVLVHELAHELLHHGEGREKMTKLVRETEAEAVSAVVSEAIGLSANAAASDYIQLYRGDAETLKASLGAIQATASAILSELMPAGD